MEWTICSIKISLYAIFFVWLWVFDLTKTFVVVIEILFESAMNNCPWENRCRGRYISMWDVCLSFDLVDCHCKIKTNEELFLYEFEWISFIPCKTQWYVRNEYVFARVLSSSYLCNDNMSNELLTNHSTPIA